MSAARLAVVHGLGIGQQFQIGVDAIGNLQQHIGPLGGGGLAPLVGRGMGRIEGQLDIRSPGASRLGIGMAADRGNDIKILALDRGNEFAADEVVVFGLELNLRAGGAGRSIYSHVSLLGF